MTARCTWEVKTASLASPFGRDFAMRAFKMTEEELAALVGRISRGPRKGLLRGHIAWGKTLTGGWVKTGAYDHDARQGCGFVAPPKLVFGHSLYDAQCITCLRGGDILGVRTDCTRLISQALPGNREVAAINNMRDASVSEAQQALDAFRLTEAARPTVRTRRCDSGLFISLDAHMQVLNGCVQGGDMDRWEDYSGWTDRPH